MTGVALGLAALLLLLAFWIRAAGTAVTRIPRADAFRDAAEGKPGAESVAGLLDARDVITPAVGVVVSALSIVSAVLGTAVLVVGKETTGALGAALAVALVAFLLGDLAPRQVGRFRPHRLAYRSSRLLDVAVGLGGWANDLLPEPEPEDEEAEGAEAEASANGQERELIDSVLEFSETMVREVMTPRPDMVTIDLGASIEELITLATEAGFSRMPVVSNGDVVGMAFIKDLLPMLGDGKQPDTVAGMIRPVEFVPETKLASSLLAEMQERHVHQVIVVDEFGDVAGLVTIEDLLEELVGEIADETDPEEALVVAREDGWDVDARLPVDDLAEITGVELAEQASDTVGGLVLGLAERVPEEGEEFTLGDLRLVVSKMQGRRVSKVRVTPAGRIEAS